MLLCICFLLRNTRQVLHWPLWIISFSFAHIILLYRSIIGLLIWVFQQLQRPGVTYYLKFDWLVLLLFWCVEGDLKLLLISYVLQDTILKIMSKFYVWQGKTCIFVTIYIFPAQAFEKLCLFRGHRKIMSPKIS